MVEVLRQNGAEEDDGEKDELTFMRLRSRHRDVMVGYAAIGDALIGGE